MTIGRLDHRDCDAIGLQINVAFKRSVVPVPVRIMVFRVALRGRGWVNKDRAVTHDMTRRGCWLRCDDCGMTCGLLQHDSQSVTSWQLSAIKTGFLPSTMTARFQANNNTISWPLIFGMSPVPVA